jgi:hypothetical protein
MYIAIACLFDEGADKGILTILIGNERQDLFKGGKNFDILITNNLMEKETKFREHFRVISSKPYYLP